MEGVYIIARDSIDNISDLQVPVLHEGEDERLSLGVGEGVEVRRETRDSAIEAQHNGGGRFIVFGFARGNSSSRFFIREVAGREHHFIFMGDGNGSALDLGGEGTKGGSADGAFGEEGVDLFEGYYVVEADLGIDLVELGNTHASIILPPSRVRYHGSVLERRREKKTRASKPQTFELLPSAATKTSPSSVVPSAKYALTFCLPSPKTSYLTNTFP